MPGSGNGNGSRTKDEQQVLLAKLRAIAEDAKTYEQDTGVHALFVGYPILHLPPSARVGGGGSFGTKRILAPIAFIPVQLTLKLTRPASVVLEATEDGSDLVIPNAALLAWVQQVTGQRLSDLFADEEGNQPWREINEIVSAVCKALELAAPPAFDSSSPIVATPRSDADDSKEPVVLSSAVLGLFPVTNQGLLKDLEALAEGEPITGPIESFLSSGAELGVRTPGSIEHDVASEQCVGAADPCQLRAVRLARKASGLVVHGPPGTGKSQTITNIIADHLAHGERVLFVCDKRTALDVVHYRLEHLGLGQLCAIVHDARRDPRELYRSIREQLDGLADAKLDPTSERSLAAANRELRQLHSELSEHMHAIQARPSEGTEPSLHELVGSWFGIAVPEDLVREIHDVPLAQLDEMERDTREVLDRGLKEGFAGNPWTMAAGLSLSEFLARPYQAWHADIQAIEGAARRVDAQVGVELLPFDSQLDLDVQGRSRMAMAELLAEAVTLGCGPELAHWAAESPEAISRAAQDLDSLKPTIASMQVARLDPELLPVVSNVDLQVPELMLWLGKLASYLQIAKRWYRFFFFGRRREALVVVQRFGLALGQQAAEKVQVFLDGLRARRVVQNWYGALVSELPSRLLPDDVLRKAVDRYVLIFRILDKRASDAGLAPLAQTLLELLQDPSQHGGLVAALRASGPRASAIMAFDGALRATALLGENWRSHLLRAACAGQPVHAEAVALVQRHASVEGILRIRDRLATMPESARNLHLELLERSVPADTGWATVRKSVLSGEISRRLAAAPVLQRLDGDRIRATYERFRYLERQRRALARDAILHRWTDRQRQRLLASTGSRLNGVGAEVRRRLVSRGERAMRLRQVIGAGASIEGGDPLFDLRPIWMASPEVVAQIFPRAPLFDVVVFDEASQCRLEEALSVLTRARRVVIAGDPKQLPPTRFFELAVAQSQSESEAETEQELFEEQQAEVEDLLTAALNISIEQAYLDVHYRSQNSDLIQFSNQSFYDARLQPIPGHPSNWRKTPPLRLVHAGGTYDKRANPKEAQEVVRLVRELLSHPQPPSIGVACFNLTQRDTIVEALDQAAVDDAEFGARLASARVRRGTTSFEGLFVKNLENVQGDERDHIIISTTYGPDLAGRFFRRFGPLGMAGGGRRLNVLVTRARQEIHIVTSIPSAVYRSLPPIESGKQPNGAWLLFSYLRFAEALASLYADEDERRRAVASTSAPTCRVLESACPSELACALGNQLAQQHGVSSEIHWGNEGFGVDAALVHPKSPEDVTIGVLCDATRFDKAPDRVQWDIFRTEILEAQGWKFFRVWTPQFVRDPRGVIAAIAAEAHRVASETSPERAPAAQQGPETQAMN
jgi:hypothetical protein